MVDVGNGNSHGDGLESAPKKYGVRSRHRRRQSTGPRGKALSRKAIAMLTGRSSIVNGHGFCALFSTGQSRRKWVNPTLYGKTTSSETHAKLRGIYSDSPYRQIGLWLHMQSCNRSCRGLSIPSIPRLRPSRAFVMTVTVSDLRFAWGPHG
jgi:hypothetical protein